MGNLCHDEPSGRGKPNHDPGASVDEMPRMGTRDMPPLRPFQALVNTVKDTTEELRSITA
jgi:hypothetical protein